MSPDRWAPARAKRVCVCVTHKEMDLCFPSTSSKPVTASETVTFSVARESRARARACSAFLRSRSAFSSSAGLRTGADSTCASSSFLPFFGLSA